MQVSLPGASFNLPSPQTRKEMKLVVCISFIDVVTNVPDNHNLVEKEFTWSTILGYSLSLQGCQDAGTLTNSHITSTVTRS